MEEYSAIFKALRDKAEQKGGYRLCPTPALIEKGLAYYNQHEADLSGVLNKAGLKAATIEKVMADYRNYCVGLYLPAADIEQMREVTNTLKPYDIYKVDKYVAFLLLFSFYSTYGKIEAEYRSQVKEATEKGSKMAFLLREFGATEAKAVLLLRADRIAVAQDLQGLEPTMIAAVFNRLERVSIFWDYLFFCATAEMAYKATDTEIAEVEAPPSTIKGGKLTPADAKDIADKLSGITEKVLADLGDKLRRTDSRNWEVVELPPILGQIFVTTKGMTAQESQGADPKKPKIERENQQAELVRKGQKDVAIKGFTELLREFSNDESLTDDIRHPNGRRVMKKFAVTRVLEGAMRLIQTQGRLNVGGSMYVVKTSLKNLARMSGYGDNPSGTQLAECYAALNFWRSNNSAYEINRTNKRTGKIEQYVVITPTLIPKLYVPTDTENGKIKVRKGAPYEIEILMPAGLFQGKPHLFAKEGYDEFRKSANSDKKNALRLILLTKNHERQSALVEEVYDYAQRLEAAQSTDKEAAEKDGKQHHENEDAFKTIWQNHYSDYVASIDESFKSWTRGGFIKDNSYINRDGEKIYKWTLGKKLNPKDKPDKGGKTE